MLGRPFRLRKFVQARDGAKWKGDHGDQTGGSWCPQALPRFGESAEGGAQPTKTEVASGIAAFLQLVEAEQGIQQGLLNQRAQVRQL